MRVLSGEMESILGQRLESSDGYTEVLDYHICI